MHQDEISIQGSEREKLGKPANLEVLKEIATITRGKMVTTEQIDEFLSDATQSKPTYLEFIERFLSRPADLRRLL